MKINFKIYELGQCPFGSAHEKFDGRIETVPKPEFPAEPGDKNGQAFRIQIAVLIAELYSCT